MSLIYNIYDKKKKSKETQKVQAKDESSIPQNER